MGYDLLMITPPRGEFSGYSPQSPATPGYFRLSSSGMGVMLTVMDKAGLLDAKAKPPNLSKVWPPRGLDEDRAEEILEHLVAGVVLKSPATERELTICSKAKIALDGLLGTSSAHKGKVPAFKFLSNDGWLVEASECECIDAGLGAALATQPEKWFPREAKTGIPHADLISWIQSWVAYNRIAATHGGYRVS